MVNRVGNKIRLTCSFTNLAGTATDPTTVTFKIREPDGTITTYIYGTDAEVVKSSTGVFYVEWILAQGGLTLYAFIGTGTVTARYEGSFFVEFANIA